MNKIDIGQKIRITPIGSNGKAIGAQGKKKNPIFTGKVVSLNDIFFNAHNGIWQESFRYSDIGIQGGIKISYL